MSKKPFQTIIKIHFDTVFEKFLQMRLFGDFETLWFWLMVKLFFDRDVLKVWLLSRHEILKAFSVLSKRYDLCIKRKNDVHTSSHLWSNDFDEKSFLYFIQPTLLELGNEVWKFAIAIFCECV